MTLHHNIVGCVQTDIRELNVTARNDRDCETLWEKLIPGSEWGNEEGVLSKTSVNP